MRKKKLVRFYWNEWHVMKNLVNTEINFLEKISEYFSSLSDQAERQAFPDFRKGIFELKDIKNWKKIPKLIYNLSILLIIKNCQVRPS